MDWDGPFLVLGALGQEATLGRGTFLPPQVCASTLSPMSTSAVVGGGREEGFSTSISMTAGSREEGISNEGSREEDISTEGSREEGISTEAGAFARGEAFSGEGETSVGELGAGAGLV